MIANQVPIPPRALNGGLYSGEPFAKGAPWGNYPAIPDVDFMTHENLKSAYPPPPPGALVQYPGVTRPGNNYQAMTGLIKSECEVCASSMVRNSERKGLTKFFYL